MQPPASRHSDELCNGVNGASGTAIRRGRAEFPPRELGFIVEYGAGHMIR